MPETLCIVHLSSIDSYVHFYGREAAQRMTNDLHFAITTHDGPIIIMEQGWNEISDDARTLRQMVLDMQARIPITIFHHDEMIDIRPWQDGMTALAAILRKFKREAQSNRVRLGGFWTSQNATTGCVHEVQRQLRARNIACYLDRGICALEIGDHRAKT